MERVSVKEFQRRISFWFKHLPIQVTSYGKVIATVIEGEIVSNISESVTDNSCKPLSVTILTDDARGQNGGVVSNISEREEKVVSNIESDPRPAIVGNLRALIAPIESQVDKRTGEIKPPAEAECRTFWQQADIDNEEVNFTGTYPDFVKALGKQKAAAAWKLSKKAP